MAPIPPVIDYTIRDYDQVRAALIALIKSRYPENWTDFTESSIGVTFLDALAYVSTSLHYMIDVVANECFLSTARDRSSVINLCRLVGYELRNPTAASVAVRITLDEAQAYSVVIPTGTSVTSENGLRFEFLESVTIPQGYKTYDAVVVEGTTVLDTFYGSGQSFQRFTTTNDSVIHNSISVYVNNAPWTYQESLVMGDTNSNIFTVQYDAYGYAIILFGDDVNGNVPPVGSTIRIVYRIGGGVGGNINIGDIEESVSATRMTTPTSLVTVSVINTEMGSGGEDAETEEHARIWAPKFNKVNGRAITLEDFETLATLYNDPVYGSPSYASARLKDEIKELNTVQVALWGRDALGIPSAPSTTLRNAVAAYFNNNGAGAVRTICTEVEIVAGENVYIDLSISFVPESDYSGTALATSITSAIQEYFRSATIRPGEDFRISKLYSIILSVQGVKHAIVNYIQGSVEKRAILGTGTGSSHAYSYSFTEEPIPNTVSIGYSGSNTVDDGIGGLTGDGTGSVDYTGKSLSVTLDAESGTEIYIEYRYVTTYYRNRVEQYYSGSGALTGTLAYPPVKSGTFTFAIGGRTIAADADGVLSGTGVASGMIDYNTGAYTITFSSPPVAGAALYSNYYQYLRSSHTDIPIAKSQLSVAGLLSITAVSEDVTN